MEIDTAKELKILTEALSNASIMFNEGQNREGIIEELFAILKFLRAMRVSSELLVPLDVLVMALFDIGYSGAQNPILKPKLTSHRPNLLASERLFRGLLSAAVDMLRKTHLPVEQSCRDVDAMLRRHGGHDVGWKAIKSWRDNARTGRIGEDVDKHTHTYMLQQISQGIEDETYKKTPKEYAEALVKIAISFQQEKSE